MWSRERLTRKQLTSRPDHLWPELWKSMGKHAKLKEKQKWSEEKLHLENARKLRGICFIDPEDTEFKETIKNARKKLETSVAPAMPCKIAKNCGSGASNKIQTKLACILEADESTRMRMGNSLPNHHEDHIAREGENSLQHYNLVHKFIPMPQATKIPAAKAAVDKEWETSDELYEQFWRIPGYWIKFLWKIFSHSLDLSPSCVTPSPLKYIDVTRVLLEKHIEDYWNVDEDRELSDAWTDFTRFILNERPPDGYTWSRERQTRKQTTSRPDSVWPDWKKHMSDASKRKAKQKVGYWESKSR